MDILNFFRGVDGMSVLSVYTAVLRISLPVLAMLIVVRSARSLLGFRREPEVWAWLRLATGELLPVTHWENVLGRKKSADIVLDFVTVSKNHAVLTRHDDDSWTITDIGARGRVQVDGRPVLSGSVRYGQTISLAGLDMVLEPVSAQEAALQAGSRTRAGKGHSPGLTLILLTILQLLAMLSLLMNLDSAHAGQIVSAYLLLIAVQWAMFIGQKLIRRSGFELETLAFFLITISLSIIASKAPQSLMKQLVAMGIGIGIFLFIGLSLRSLETARKVRYLAAAAGIVLLLVNLVLGREQFGAKNWIYLGGFSFQPSELVKICFIFAGASTMDRVVTKRNLILFIAYTGFIGLCLAYMNDFGTAAIFFVCFLVIAYLRSGSFATVALMIAVVVMAGLLAIRFFPYVMRRFETWGHIWEHATEGGFQQTRSLMCIASGGLFGLGLGNGWLKYVAASDTDLVFAFVCEEWGLVMGVVMIFALAVLGIFVVRSSAVGRSSFYTIAASAAMAIFMMQAILNFFGTVDFLPLTGVTFPFVSNGGSSMMAAWGLLAFIKACDTRQNASFAVKMAGKGADAA